MSFVFFYMIGGHTVVFHYHHVQFEWSRGLRLTCVPAESIAVGDQRRSKKSLTDDGL